MISRRIAATALVSLVVSLAAPLCAGAASWTDGKAPKASWTDTHVHKQTLRPASPRV